MATERNEHGDFPAVLELSEQARRGAREAGDRPLEALAAAMAADAAQCALRGDDPDAVAAVDRRIAEAGGLIDALSDDQVAAHLDMLLTLTITRLFNGNFPGARAAGERGLTLARRTRQGLLTPAFVVRARVRGPGAGTAGVRARPIRRRRSTARCCPATSRSRTGRRSSRACSRCSAGRSKRRSSTAKSPGICSARVSTHRPGSSIADARLAAGDPAGARAVLEAFGWVRPQMWTLDRVKAADVAVRVLLALGRLDEAAAWADRVPFESGGRRTGIFGAIAARSRAAVLLATGAPQEAARIAAGGAAAADAAHAPVWAGRCRTLAGEALAAAGRTEAAREQLRSAASELDALGAFGPRDAAREGAAPARRSAAAAGPRRGRRRRRPAPGAAEPARA